MKRIVCSALMMITITGSLAAQKDTIQAKEARKYVGKNVTLCDRVNYGRYVNQNKTDPVRLYVGPDYPNHYLTLLFEQNDLKRFSFDPEKKMINKRFCVEGTISTYRGRPAIIVKKEPQINEEE